MLTTFVGLYGESTLKNVVMHKLYYFRPNLKEHFPLYYSWIEASRLAGVDVKMFTILTPTLRRKYEAEYNKIALLPNVSILTAWHKFLVPIILFLYLARYVIASGGAVVVCKKVNVSMVLLYKYFLLGRLRVVVELEGDAKTERDFLIENFYKESFYIQYIKNLDKQIYEQKKILKRIDRVLVHSTAFREELLKRSPFLSPSQVHAIATGFVEGRFRFDIRERNAQRKKLGIGQRKVFIYVGNAEYSWQNLKKTFKFFKHYYEVVDRSSFFIVITMEADQPILKEFATELSIDDCCWMMESVPNEEVGLYLYAADVGLLFRPNHPMCEFGSPGKLGEYAAAGLPILTSSFIGDYRDKFRDEHCVRLFEDLNDFELLSTHASELLKLTTSDRNHFSDSSNKKFSSRALVDDFLKTYEF